MTRNIGLTPNFFDDSIVFQRVNFNSFTFSNYGIYYEIFYLIDTNHDPLVN
jgi:hypothetical protein